jgi:hypothetical protein
MRRPASKSGKQQRPSFSDPTATLFGVAKRQPLDLLIGVAPPSAEDFVWGYQINGQPIPPLNEGWLDLAQAQCPAGLSASSREQLKGVVECYLVGRFALATSTSYRDLTSTLEKIDKAAKALLDAIEIYDHGHVLAWRELEATLPHTLKRDDVYPVISLLVSRTHVAAAHSKTQTEINRSTFSPKKVWEEFAKGLAAVFKANGWDVKISKSRGNGEGIKTAHPSRFVNFAWALISCLPKDLREHCSSPWTLADALRPPQTKPKGTQRSLM